MIYIQANFNTTVQQYHFTPTLLMRFPLRPAEAIMVHSRHILTAVRLRDVYTEYIILVVYIRNIYSALFSRGKHELKHTSYVVFRKYNTSYFVLVFVDEPDSTRQSTIDEGQMRLNPSRDAKLKYYGRMIRDAPRRKWMEEKTDLLCYCCVTSMIPPVCATNPTPAGLVPKCVD